jgi:hypothetical protein
MRRRRAVSVIHRMSFCPLCHCHGVKLRESHLMARAFYARIRKETGFDPIQVTPTLITQKSGQVKATLLCDACESRISTRGEKWMLENYPQMNGSFPLQAALRAATPFKDLNGNKHFEGSSIQAIELQKLIYFAVSVFWRAAVCRWRALDQCIHLELGPYKEALRLYLLDKAAFPQRASLHILVSPAAQPRGSVNFPSTYCDKPSHRHGLEVAG